MKVNSNLLQKLKEKNINLDIDKYSKQLKTQSNAPTQVSSSEVDSMDSSFMVQSINFNNGNTQQNSNFRVRPMSAKREDSGDVMRQSQMGFSMTQNQFNHKNSQKTLVNNSQYQNLIDQRLNQKSSQSNRTATSSQSTIQSREAQGKIQSSPTNGNNYIVKTMAQSFYKESEKAIGKKDNGVASNIQKPSDPKNDKNPQRQNSIKDRKGSADIMTVSLYKDSKQNKIREDLLNYSGEEENFSDFNKQNDDDRSSNYSGQIQNYSNQLLRQSSSKRSGFGETDDEGNEINKDDNKFKENIKRDNAFRKSQSALTSNNHSRNTSEDKNKSKQELDDFLEKYDRMNNQGDESQNNSFDEELMILVQKEFISESITAELIEKITDIKQENFEFIRRITLCHDCEQDSLQLLGELCPNINELNINGSIVNSLRDIGTSMRNLKVLWISRVHLQDFSGLNAFPLLVELYASYNQVKNVSDLYFHENIEVLDLEGNDIESDQIEVIETMTKLKVLNLSLNPITKRENYRLTIRQKISQLQLLDDIPIEKDAAENNTTSKTIMKRRGFPISSTSTKQENIIEEEEDLYECLKKLNWNGEKFLSDDVVRDLDQELKQELNEDDLLIYSVKKTSKATKMNKNNSNDTPSNLKNSNIFGSTMNNFNSTASNFKRPQTAATPKNTGFGGGNINQQNPFSTRGDSISSLVEGTDQAFCGNPLKALKHKRKNDFVAVKKNESEQDTINIPKNIVNLLDQFKQETGDDGMNKLKEELKFYDFMVEQQMNLQKKKSDAYASYTAQNGESEQHKAKIVIKRPQIKLRTTSSNSQTKDTVPEKQLDIQQQFKELQNKSRLPVRPMLLSQKVVKSQIN